MGNPWIQAGSDPRMVVVGDTHGQLQAMRVGTAGAWNSCRSLKSFKYNRPTFLTWPQYQIYTSNTPENDTGVSLGLHIGGTVPNLRGLPCGIVAYTRWLQLPTRRRSYSYNFGPRVKGITDVLGAPGIGPGQMSPPEGLSVLFGTPPTFGLALGSYRSPNEVGLQPPKGLHDPCRKYYTTALVLNVWLQCVGLYFRRSCPTLHTPQATTCRGTQV